MYYKIIAIPIVFATIVIAGMFWALESDNTRRQAKAPDCAAKGGTLIRADRGYLCVKELK